MPTINPVPSTDPSDLLFNAGKLDEVVNGTSNSFTDRLGVSRRTVAGMNADFDAQLADAESDLNVYRADASASAAEALGYLQTIRATSYGAYAEDPTTDPLGNPPTVGDEYFNTTSNLLKRWNGTTWQASDINTANLAASSGSSLVGYDGGTVQDVLDAVTGTNGAAYVGYQPAGAGAVATTVQAKLRESVSVKDFGAVGDGVVDDTAAIQAALDTLKPVIFPNGIYKTSSSLKVYNNVDFDGSTINSSSAYCFDLREIKNVSLINGRLYSTATSGSVIYVGGLWNGEIRNCHIKPGGGQNGITFDAKHKDSSYPYFGVFCVQVVDCHIEGGFRGIVSNWVDASRRNTHITIIGGWLQSAYASLSSNGDANLVVINTAFDSTTSQYHVELINSINGYIQPGEFPVPASLNHVVAIGSNEYTVIRVNQRDCVIAGTPTIPPAVESSRLLEKYATNSDGYYYKIYTTFSYNDVFNIDLKRDGAVFNAVKWTGNDLKLSNGSMILGSSGNVGFGGTLNTWDNSARAIELPYGAIFTTNGSINLFQNAYYGVGAFKYQSTAAASYYSQLGGAHSWFSASSGTAGATVTFSKRLDLSAAGVLTPGADNTQSLGSASQRWSVVYAGTGTINTSDERQKQDIEGLTEAELRVATALKGLVKKFRFKDAVQAKGDGARIHVGVIAQEVMAAFQAEGLDSMRYGIICYDKWPEKKEVLDENGWVTQEYRPAGNRYGVRYEELLAFIIAAL